jgi:hypothetical protein
MAPSTASRWPGGCLATDAARHRLQGLSNATPWFLTVAGRIVRAMGKARRAKQQRRAAPRRELAVVDACEVAVVTWSGARPAVV